MKKTAAIIAALSMLCTLNVMAYGEENPRIYGVIAEGERDGSHQYVQLVIENNPGIMGYKLILEYDSEAVEVLSAHRGEALSEGMFVDSAGDTPGTTQLLWNSSENSADNGVFAILEIEQKGSAPYEIKVKCSQEDTFNEAWEDVLLTCENISSEKKQEDSSKAEEIEKSIEEALPERMEQEIFSLDTEQSPGDMIGDFLEEIGETELTEINVRKLHSLFESEGLSREYGEKLSDSQLLGIYEKALGDYSAAVQSDKKTERGNKPVKWLWVGVPIAAAGIVILIYRRMKNIEKRRKTN